MDDCPTPTPTPVGDSMMEDEDSELRNDYENYVESEEDVDCRELPGDVKRLYWSYEDEPHFHHYYSMFYEKFPPKYPNYFDKVKRHPGDDQLLVARHVPWITEHRHPIHARESLAKHVVADKLSYHAKFHELWNKVRAVALATSDNSFANTTKAAASLLYRLYTMDYLYKIGRKRTLDDQKIELWDEIELMLKKVCSFYEACQKIVHLVEDKDKYSFLTECDVAEMLGGYDRQLGKPDGWGFDRPFFTGENHDHYTKLDLDQVKIQILKDINDVVMQMEVPSIFQVDDYSRMLIHILRRPEWEEWDVVDLVKDAMKIFDIDSTDGKETIARLLDNLYDGVKNSMKMQLTDAVVQPLYLLSMNILGLRHVSHEILMIVQIAELRRMALGCRFIGRSHLIWAFYERGYGLPKIRKAILNSHDRDHPPYHIYVATMKIAKAYCLKKARLEHFIFAVLFAVDNIFDCSEKKWTGLLQDFEDFTEDITWVRTETGAQF